MRHNRVMLPQVVLKAQKARTFASRHPWVLDKAIDRIEAPVSDGDEVDLVTHRGKFLARGIFNGQSRIRVRLYTWNRDERLDEAFWRRRLEAAIALRRLIGYDDPLGAARLVFSEGDGLSGLVVDRYADYLAIQVTSLGIARRLDEIVALLVDLALPQGVVLRTEKGMNRAEGIELHDGLLWGRGPEGPVVVVEASSATGWHVQNEVMGVEEREPTPFAPLRPCHPFGKPLKWKVDLLEGQKTGFYLDQRENRRAMAAFMGGRRVLDMFCYTGGFSLAASAWGGATDVLAFDSSPKAIELARANAQLNAITNVRFETGDAFETLESLVGAGERFGAVILDPPKFARTRAARDDALRAYHWLNRTAIGILDPGGILVTCSCSGLVTREDFLAVLVGAAQQSGRHFQVLQQRGASPDHPVAVNCLESEYLKCFICRAV
jgi:23S rRNA (cytosine1962-C5)-methyltransferase